MEGKEDIIEEMEGDKSRDREREEGGRGRERGEKRCF